MQQLFYPNEIRSMDDLDLGEAIVKDNELKMAVQLAEMGAADEFHPENYRDEVAERVRKMIQKKIDGEEITTILVEEPRAGHRSDGSAEGQSRIGASAARVPKERVSVPSKPSRTANLQKLLRQKLLREVGPQ